MARYYHLFPFVKIKKGSRLVLYGGGEVGQWYLAQLMATGYADVVAVVDRAWLKYPSLSVPCLSPEQLSALAFDYVVVSIEDDRVAASVAYELTEIYGIDMSRIIIGSNSLAQMPFLFRPCEKKRENSVVDNVQNSNGLIGESYSKIKVSVVIPVYNVAPYLRQCLTSVTRQILHEIEIICIDDCSTDDSFDILREFAEKDNRLIVLRNPRNMGAARTRNIGLQIAKGEYIAFWDADDWYDSQALSKIYELCHENDADLGIHDVLRHDEQSGEQSLLSVPKDIRPKLQNPFSFEQLPVLRLFSYFTPAPQSKLFRRQFLLKHGLAYQHLPACNDVSFYGSTLAIAERIVYLQEPLTHYRYNFKGQTTFKRASHPLDIYEAMQRLHDILKARGKWNLCAKAFREFSTQHIYAAAYELFAKEPKAQSCLVEFMRRYGWAALDMEDCQLSDFIWGYYYERYARMAK